MAPSKVMSFHSQFFHLQFSDGTLLAQGFSPFKIFPLQFQDGAFLAEYFSPTVFSPAVLGWDLANARIGLGTSRMPMRGKLRCSFRCTLIFVARLMKSFFMAARIYFQIFEQNVVFVHAKCVTKLAQVRRCLWPDRNITRHHFAWPD